jgi:3-oxoacyl-[acyl-carrier protein] reductase
MRNVLVTGGSRGIGLGIARRLAQSGYRVVAVARKPSDELSAAITAAETDGLGSIHFAAADLGEIDRLGALVRGIRKEFGPIYGLVNNAALGTEGLLATMQNPDIEQLIRVNTLAPIVLTKYVARQMMAERAGRIVNVSSIIGFTGYNALSVYAATKASMIGFTRSLSREVGKLGITVNAVAPGFIETHMTSGLAEAERERVVRRSALGRLPDVADVANAVDFLLGDGGRNITGTVMTIDAGSTA